MNPGTWLRLGDDVDLAHVFRVVVAQFHAVVEPQHQPVAHPFLPEGRGVPNAAGEHGVDDECVPVIQLEQEELAPPRDLMNRRPTSDAAKSPASRLRTMSGRGDSAEVMATPGKRGARYSRMTSRSGSSGIVITTVVTEAELTD